MIPLDMNTLLAEGKIRRWVFDYAVKLRGTPHCCTATILTNLGGSPNSTDGLGAFALTEIEFDSVLQYQMQMTAVGRYSAVVAYITTDQEVAAGHLERVGFKMLSQTPNPKHPDNELQIWMISGADLVKFYNPKPEPVARRFSPKV